MQIANNNFNNLTALTKITFGNNLLKIKSNTFNNLSNLEDVFFPSSLISIGRYSFYNCNATWTNKNIVTDAVDGVTISYFKINKNMICQGIYYIDTTQEIDDLLLKYQSYGITNANDSINNLVFATNVIGVSDFAFANLPINNLYINQNMFYIGENAFYNSQINHIYNLNAINHIGAFGFAKNNFTTVNLPNIAELYDSAFAECSSLTSVTLSNNLIGLANNLFYNCNQLDSISFSYKLETIGDYCFYNTKLTSFRCPNSLYQIGEGAFFSNVELINFNYGNSIVNKIDFLTFGNCIKLTNLSTNKNINKIMANPFLGCTLLERENNFTNENNIVYFAHNNINYCLGGNALIPLKNEAANDYIEAYYAITTNLIATPNVTIRSNTNIIVPYAFYLLDDITSITFNQQLTSIAEYSFYRSCLTQLTIPSNVTQLGEYAFSGSEIVTLNLNAISTIPRHCFSNNKIASLNFVNGNREVLD
jgi:hypothetical protein